ncbi:helix-turn-helix domain-containing protein [Streptomyces sp. NPDC090298]|uniref:helix-turn-helix domain-containing protein n=1 Tax=Streptomyces sp. NPDC090298 TaxID=3365959 RepID=UPI003826FC34
MATAQTPQATRDLTDFHSGGSDLMPVEGAAPSLAEYRLHRVEDAAVFLRIKRTKAYEEIRLGRLRTVRIGRRRLVPTEYIDDYVELLKREAEAA